MFLVFLLLACGLSFGAFVIWLTVRTINRPERWAKRALWAIAGLTPVLYVLSLGPFAWMVSAEKLPVEMVESVQYIYLPLKWIYTHGPTPIHDGLHWYVRICSVEQGEF